MHTTVKPGRNVCPECNEQFALKATLKNHLASKHGSGSISKRQTQDTDPKIPTTVFGTYSVSPSFPTTEVADTTYYPFNGYSNSNSVYSTIQTSNGDIAPTTFSLHSDISRTTTDVETSGYETDTTIIPTDTPPFKCDLCVKLFDAEWKWNQHNGSDGHLLRLKLRKAGTESASENDERRFTDEDTGYETDKPLVAPTNAHQTFHCKFCVKSFEVESRFIQHKNSDGHKQKVKQLKDSGDIDKPTETFSCNFEECSRKFDSEVKLLQHQVMKHGIKTGVVESEGSGSETDFRCTDVDCDKIFPTKQRLLQHMRDKHSADKNDSSTLRQLCQYCDEFNETAGSKPFIFLTFIAKHILTAHEKPGYIKGTCPICQTRVEKQKNLLTHISRSHLFNKFKDEACFICLRLCKNKDDLLQHSTSVHRFKCAIDTCHSMFPSKPLRDKHMLDKHSVYGCGMENCQRIFPTLEEKIEHMRMPHKGEASEPVIACSRGLANVHDGGAMSEPTAFHLVREQSPAHHARNSADESVMRSAVECVSDLFAIHRTLQEKVEDLTLFIDRFSGHLNQATNQSRSEMTFEKCEELKYAIEGVQRRLTPRVD